MTPLSRFRPDRESEHALIPGMTLLAAVWCRLVLRLDGARQTMG
jgi:hypothetical protein